MSARFVLALDQGTTGSAAIVFDEGGMPVGSADREITQHYPRPGWVSHDANEIYQTTVAVAREAIANAGVEPSQIAAIGITNQRETTVVWDRRTGEPIDLAIVWQCRRTAAECRRLVAEGLTDAVRERTGLVIDAYFSGTKIAWLLDNVAGARERAERGELAFGTIDSWLLWKLTGVHATDVSNASRTMLFDITRLDWDDELLAAVRVPKAVLPRVCPSSWVFGESSGVITDRAIPVAGIAGDQHAALFGQACFERGMTKNTYGTGSFMLMQTGTEPVPSTNGLLTTPAWGIGGGAEYALEGSVFVTGAAIQWLRDGLRLIDYAAETEQLALSIADSGGVYVVPAFVGLGAPHWDMDARGTIVGLTGGAGREHIVRATLESIAYQTADVLRAMESDAGVAIPTLRVDGGGTANGFLMQFQSDILDRPIEVAAVQETTARGAAYLAGLATGAWRSTDEITAAWKPARRFEPSMSPGQRALLVDGWRRAVERAKGWANPE